MPGIGSVEAGIIFIVVLLLFAPTLVAFLIGYTIGQRRGASAPSPDSAESPTPDTAAAPEVPTADADAAPEVPTADAADAPDTATVNESEAEGEDAAGD